MISSTIRHYVIIALCHLIPLCSCFPLLTYSVTKYFIIKLPLLFLGIEFTQTSNLIPDNKNDSQIFLSHVSILFCFTCNVFVSLSWTKLGL